MMFRNVSLPRRKPKCWFRAFINFLMTHLIWGVNVVWGWPWTAQEVNFLIYSNSNRPLSFSKWVLGILTLNMLLRNLTLRSLSIVNLRWRVHSKIISLQIWVKHIHIFCKPISHCIWFMATWMSNFGWEQRRPWVVRRQNFSECIFHIQFILKNG
jgi:hypothetical protein